MVSGHVDVVEQLLNAGASVCTGDGGCVPLIIAAQTGSQRMVDLLLTTGAVVNAIDFGDGSALYQAVSRGHKAVVERLLAAGAHVVALPSTWDCGTIFSVAASSGLEGWSITCKWLELMSTKSVPIVGSCRRQLVRCMMG